jgi:hypothetical protein
MNARNLSEGGKYVTHDFGSPTNLSRGQGIGCGAVLSNLRGRATSRHENVKQLCGTRNEYFDSSHRPTYRTSVALPKESQLLSPFPEASKITIHGFIIAPGNILMP